MKKNRRFSYFNRENITLFFGYLALILGAIQPWYHLNKQGLETFATNLYLVNTAKQLVILFAILGLVFSFKNKSGNVHRLLFYWGFLAVLLFPFLLNLLSPSVNYLAASYQEQLQQVIRNVETNIPEIQANWKQNISLGLSKPISSIFNFPIQDSRFFQMSSWTKIVLDCFGYNNNFFSFIGRGWGLTIAGFMIGLVGFYLKLKQDRIHTFIKDMNRFLPGSVFLLLITFIFLFLINIINHRLDTLFAKGEYHKVLATSQILASWYPPLTGDEVFLKRMAEAGYYGNEPNPALINFVQGLERYQAGDYASAETSFQNSLNFQPNLFLVRGYLASAMINAAVDYFQSPNLPNSPNKSPFPYKGSILDSVKFREEPKNLKPTGSAELFEKALQIFPGHIEALYDLMLVRAINGEFERSAEAAQKIIELQKYFQQPSSALLGQAYTHLTWDTYHKEDIPKAWKRYRQTFDPRTWKQPVEEEK